tara:strand:- start:159 stop:1157 length:999 start_codon:yes stop_codon:yes gene_type:complete
LSTEIRIHIHCEFHDGPWGGGNQFLKALRNELIRKDCYVDDPENGDVILFNSHHHLKEIMRLERRYRDKIFVHRVDGPISYRGEEGRKTDKTIFTINSLVADGTVFQSNWSRRESHKQGMKDNHYETVIHNAPDPNIFAANGQAPRWVGASNGKIRLIAMSWSINQGKGFDIYHFLDEHLDFEKYEMTFVGRSDRSFENINIIGPVPSEQVAQHLHQHDIFVSASKLEACSNSLVEALNCRLPSVVMNTSSNPEILGERGQIFDGKEDVIQKIEKVAENIDDYRQTPPMPNIEVVGERYCQFFEMILSEIRNGHYRTKRLTFLDSIRLRFTL